MERPTDEIEDAQARVDQAEEQDDQARLTALEELHARLERELERDDPQSEARQNIRQNK